MKRGALFVIANAAATGSAGQIAYLVEHDAVSALAGTLDASETRCITAALKALHTILATQRGHGHPRVAELLEECDAVGRVEALQEHASEEVYRLAVRAGGSDAVRHQLLPAALHCTPQQPWLLQRMGCVMRQRMCCVGWA